MTKPIVSGLYRTFRALNSDESYIEFEGSTITIPMRGRRSPKEPWLEESIKLRAFMRLEIYPPYANNLGTREFQFTIRDWDLYGKSPMLNQLFYDDPRGQLVVDEKTGLADYVPAVVTFTVSHHYKLGLDPSTPESVREIFGSDSDIEIRNLTSHHLRVWAPIEEMVALRANYSNPHNRIYWQIVSPDALKAARLDYLHEAAKMAGKIELKNRGALIVFHKKVPGIPGDSSDFDIANAQDRARYLLAVAPLLPVEGRSPNGRPRTVLRAVLPVRGFEGSTVQTRGNTVLSSLYHPRQPLEIRVPVGTQYRSVGDMDEKVNKLFSNAKTTALKGWIQIISPARSLGTADQAPDVGHPHDSADFPARITYAINYDIYINRERFVEDQAGIAIAVGAQEVPPRDVKVAFEKPQAGLVANRFLEFSSGSCTGMVEIAAADYEQGLNFGRYWRTVPLAPDELRRSAEDTGFQNYDPTREY